MVVEYYFTVKEQRVDGSCYIYQKEGYVIKVYSLDKKGVRPKINKFF
jgi:hypothetical protein